MGAGVKFPWLGTCTTCGSRFYRPAQCQDCVKCAWVYPGDLRHTPDAWILTRATEILEDRGDGSIILRAFLRVVRRIAAQMDAEERARSAAIARRAP